MDERLVKVRELLSEGKVEGALGVARSIAEPYWRDYALRWVIPELAKEEGERALEVAEGIRTESIRDEVLRGLSYTFSRVGKFKLAIKAAWRIKSDYQRKRALSLIAESIAKVIVERGEAGVSLSELGLDEEDLEKVSRFLPQVSIKDGRLMPGAELLRMKGEVMAGVVEPPKAPSWFPPAAPRGGASRTYLLDYFLLLRDEGDIEGLLNWASLLGGPLRGALLWEAAALYSRLNSLDDLFSLCQALGSSRELRKAVKELFISGRIGEALECSRRLPAEERLFLAGELLEGGFFEEKAFRELLWDGNYKLSLALKALAFELLEESKRRKDEGLRLLSKRVFDLGVEVRWEGF
ncbi:hypothetical protein [Thermococcus sp.]